MKVLVIAADPVTPGAFSVRIRALVKQLATRGHQVVLLSGAQSPLDPALRRLCDEVLTYPFEKNDGGIGWLLQRVSAVPDIYGPWARRIARDVAADAWASRPDIVVVTSPPHGIQLLGSVIAERCGIPYVADLRDDWLGNHRARWPSAIHKHLARREEKRMTAHASAIIANTDHMRTQFVGRHPSTADRVTVITNAFEESDFEFRGTVDRASGTAERIRVGYFGSDYAGYTSGYLRSLAAEMVSRGESAKWEIIAHVGTDESVKSVDPDLLKIRGHLPQQDAGREMMCCDVLLLFMPPGEREPSPTVPLKAYSYLRSRRPIVYCGESGATTALLARFDGTWSLPRVAPSTLAEWLIQQRTQWGKVWSRPAVADYGFDAIGSALESLLLRIVERHCLGTSASTTHARLGPVL